MTSYVSKLEKVDLDEFKPSRRGVKKYPWHLLVNPGDSFIISGLSINAVSAVVSAVKNVPRFIFKRFACKTEKDKNGNIIGVRVVLMSWEDPREGYGPNSKREKIAKEKGEDDWYIPPA